MCCLTGQYHSAKKRLVQLAVLYGWHYQNKSKFFFFFCDNNIILTPPPPPPPHLSILKLWFNFILGLNFIFFCFKLIIIHYHTQKPTYRGRNQPRLLTLETLFLTSPLSPTVNSPNNPTTGRRSKSSKQDPRVALCCLLVFI